MKILDYFRQFFSGPLRSLGIYWEAYGGFRELWKSPYLLLAMLTAIPATYLQLKPSPWDWAAEVINILPDILGFSLGGYAMLVGFGDKDFLAAMRGRNEDGTPSVYMEVNGAFVHFIVVQATALIFATVSTALGLSHFIIIAFWGIFLLFYALGTVISTTLAVLNFADWFDEAKNLEDD
ncbi:hypothetical protein GGQ74_002442 [Desulfobaculum xiamenense]|uniref:Uncharacterized protein n=1 Tax=Desulfobaculum xiamenense TaxID=995050 RepID=A0A846QVV8_9BACT|nr:hypothetical protein [Desulfobaculum xiamenense]NJB68769.1 hypothetical protein [Desulfobaculum xiamenense]